MCDLTSKTKLSHLVPVGKGLRTKRWRNVIEDLQEVDAQGDTCWLRKNVQESNGHGGVCGAV